MAPGKPANFHEHLSHDDDKAIGSDRSFGFVFTVFFTLVGGLPLLASHEPRLWAFAVAGGFLSIALLLPKLLHPLNVVWMAFGALLNKIVSPVVMGLLFFFTVTPMAIVIRLMGKDLLRLKWDKNAKSYWIERTPPGPPPDTMSRQF